MYFDLAYAYLVEVYVDRISLKEHFFHKIKGLESER